MNFMVIERFRPGCAREIYSRLRGEGRLTPAGVRYVSAWVDLGIQRCLQVMEADDEAAVEGWTQSWADLIEFEIIPVQTSAQAAVAMEARP